MQKHIQDHMNGNIAYSANLAPKIILGTKPRATVSEPVLSFSHYYWIHTLAFGLAEAGIHGASYSASYIFLARIAGFDIGNLWQQGDLSWWIAAFYVCWGLGASLTHLIPGWGLGAVEELRRQVLLLTLTYGGLAALVALTHHEVQAAACGFFAGAFVVSLFAVPYGRILMKRLLLSSGIYGIPTAVYGAGEAGTRVIQMLRDEKGLGLDPIVAYDDQPERWGSDVSGVHVLGSAELVMPRASAAVLVTSEINAARQIELLEGPLLHYRTVLIVSDTLDMPTLSMSPRELNGVFGLQVDFRLTSRMHRFQKRVIDMGLVLAGALVWMPAFLVLTALIWLEDRQNPFYLQERIGENGEMFKTIKFRTMVPNAEAVLLQKLEDDEGLRREWEANFKLRHDPRITRVGSFLRRFSLDEIPQLVNVLRGEMSLVGPRPLPRYHHEDLPERVSELRIRATPGITGLWQVSGRSDAGTEGMIRWDPYYVRNWSLWLDLVILVRTVRAVISRSGAY